MNTRAAALIAFVILPSVTASGQTWTPPRTPWGDPDLQGDYSNKYEQGTPFERPAEFEGRTIDDIKGDELARLVKERAVEVLLNSPFTGGDPVAGNFGGAPAFYDRFEADRGSRPWFVVDPPDGRIPPMTPEGQQASAARAAARAAARRGRGPADSYIDRSLYDRCITRGLPGSMMPANYGNSYRIVQGPGFVAISYEMVHETRVIPLDGRPRLGSAIRQYMGEGRGRWEGDTLVVETTNFRDEPVYRGSNPARLRLIERFTPIARDRILWSVTVDDASTWTRPWTFAMPLTRSEGEAIFEYACHEGNRAMANLLSAARTEEKTGARATSESRTPPPSREGANPGSRVSALAGDWRIAGTGGRGNFAGYSTPTRLTIQESAAEVTIDTDTGTENQMQSATYRLDGADTAVPGPLGWDTKANAARREDALVVTITRTIDGPDGKLRFEIRDTYRVSGDVLTLERTQGSQSRKMTYNRVR
ncbi:MAG TPA: hypothetical protein VFO58_22180, partial [Vicinamibacterales bacterium]|nr:hypothetical protein [Vicinamibacterales bacterium]